MATTQRKRAPTQTATRSKPIVSFGTLGSGTNTKSGKKKASGSREPQLTDEEKRLASMRAVNAASQTLSSVLQTGWKKATEAPSGKRPVKSGTLSTVTEAAESAASHLATLRALSPNDINVERAAISVLGKLVSIEMYDAATLALKESYPRLCAHLNVSSTARQPREQASHLSLPIPSSPTYETDSTLLTLVSTHLAYSIVTFVQGPSAEKLIHTLADTLDFTNSTAGDSATFLSWLPSCNSLPSKHLDSLVSRVYNTLTKFCTTSLSAPASSQRPTSKRTSVDVSLHRDAYRIRLYAVQCLAYATHDVVPPATLWEQAVRFGTAYVKAVTGQGAESEDVVARTVLCAHSGLVHCVESLSGQELFVKERAFMTFLDWWMPFARRANDLQTLNKISALMRSSFPSSASSNQVSDSSNDVVQDATPSEPTETPSKDKDSRSIEALVLRSAHICTVFAQIVTLIDLLDKERDITELTTRTGEVLQLFSRSKSLHELLVSAYTPSTSDSSADALRRASDKCDRALEKLRQGAIKVIETVPASNYDMQESRSVTTKLLEGCVDLFERTSKAHPCSGFFTRALDTLFILARTTLIANDPRTHGPAYGYLERAVKFLQLDQERENNSCLGISELANYVRCVSGSFHNLGGMLYQAGSYGSAVGFLVDACRLGQKALTMHLSIEPAKKNDSKGDEAAANQREADGWRQLEEQIHRRWELLGVCYAKIGDRGNAYTAFVECIKSFPYQACGFAEKTRHLGPNALFESAPALKQLASIVDRVTYMAVCELFLDPAKVSLSHPSLWPDMVMPEKEVIGALLERQINSLEGSRWKSNVKLVLYRLLMDTNDVYDNITPIRKARTLLRWMEFEYNGGLPDDSSSQRLGTVTELGEEVECLSSREDLAMDAELRAFCSQYRASAHLWCALHAHHKGDAEQNAKVADHADLASSILKKLLSDAAREPRKSSSKISSPRKTPPKRGGPSTRRATAAPVKTRARVTRKVTVKEPVTPKPKARTALQEIPLNGSPKTLLDSATSLVIDDFEKFLKLLQTTARILGFIALTLPKVHVLDATRKICEKYAGVSSDGYISASIDLAHEYVKLGKLRRASAVFNHALTSVRSGQVSDDVCTLFLLRYAEALAVLEDVHQSSTVYYEALVSSQRCAVEEKNMPTLQKVQLRVKRLERAAMAAHVFALIQYARNDIISALDGMLQSLRLWNRAADALARLNPTTPSKVPEAEKDVFDVTSLKEALPGAEPSQPKVQEKKSPRPSLDNLEWRISEGLLSTLFSLCQTYLFRGSAKEAEYFAQQAHDLSQSLNAPALLSRALAKKGDILLQLGKLEGAHDCLVKASEILVNIPGIDSADVCRLRGDHSQRAEKHEDAQQMYVETTTMLEELDTAFKHFDGLALGPRKSAGLMPTDKPAKEMIVPDLLASVLRQQIWLLRDEGGDEYMSLLEKLMALPYSSRTKAEENALMAQLTLHNVYSRFRNDMFLSSLSESAIALPMGMTSKTEQAVSPTSRDLLSILDSAANLFWANLSLIAVNGRVPDVRNATTSLALISAFQTSLGRPGQVESALAARLLDISSAITLQRELLEAIPHKFFDVKTVDDLEWPLITIEGKPLPRQINKRSRTLFDSEGDEDEDVAEKNLKDYWDSVREKCQTHVHDVKSLSSSLTQLPPNWTVVHTNITVDKSTLFISRQRGGITESSPLIFCVPLKGRRDSGTGDEDENHLTFEAALTELRDIVKLSDEGTRLASGINPDDELARAQWWKGRRELDQRLKDLLDNIEFCWLGAFKTILNPVPDCSPEILTELRMKLEKLFQQCLGLRDKQSKTRKHKSSIPIPTVDPSQLSLDDALVECFSTLYPKCRDEELEDLIYFVLDLYQFHGIRVAIAEIDMMQLAIDLRAALEEHAGKVRKFNSSNPPGRTTDKDEHIFLVLGKDLQGIPWESIPILRGRSVSRVPSLHFLLDRVDFVNRQRSTSSTTSGIGNAAPFGAHVDPRKGYYVLNPSGDLGRTQERFSDWVKEMEKVGWHGTVGRPPSEQEFLDALQRKDLVVYFGHGGGEQYVRTHRIRNLARCAPTMLWGCSSGALREMGDFDRTGTPNSYFVAGCPTLVANLWDVTDKDIDKFSQAVFETLHLSANHLKKTSPQPSAKSTSIVEAVAQAREVCKLKFLTGAAPIVYGIPFYL